MASSLSSSKRIRQNEVRRLRNQARKSRLKKQIHEFQHAVAGQESARAEQALSKAQKLLDQTAAKRTIHRNAAARKKSRLAKALNKLKASAEAKA